MQIVEHNACCKDGGEGEDGGGDTQDEARTLGCSGSQGPAVEEERASPDEGEDADDKRVARRTGASEAADISLLAIEAR